MKALLLVTSALAASVAIANASDGVAAGPTTFDWTGGYVGIQGGYAGGNSTYAVDIFPQVTIAYDPSGWLGGIYAGYSKSVGSAWVLGIEGDLAGGGIESGRTQVFNPDPINQYGNANLEWQAALRGRLGYGVGRTLPYVTAGLAVASFEHSVEGMGFYDDFSSIEFGATIGVGVDYAVTDNLVARAEYRFTDYGSGHYELGSGGALPHTVSLSLHDVRLGVAYKF